MPPGFPVIYASRCCVDRTMANSACADVMSIIGGNMGTLVPGMVGAANGNPGLNRLPLPPPLTPSSLDPEAAAAAAAVAADNMPKFRPFREGKYLKSTIDDDKNIL